MKRLPVFFALAATLATGGVQAADGLQAVSSPYGAKETMDRLEAIVKEKGMTVFARIDHAAGAAKIGAELRPTELLIFGNPKGGTPLMNCVQTFGIDLPLKALVWQDGEGTVWLGYNDMAYLAQRHGAEDCPPVAKISGALEGFAQATVAKPAQ